MSFFAKSAAIMAISCAGLLAGSALADETSPLAGYTRTGKTESCLQTINIQETRILNDHQILFKMRGGSDYLNETSNCTGLRKHLSLEYTADNDELCDTTIVHLKDYGSPVSERGTCGLDKFQELSRKTAAAN